MAAVEHPTADSGNWYATVNFWRPQAASLVDEATLFPALLPLAPTSSGAARIPEAFEFILTLLEVSTASIASERSPMSEANFSRTADRSVLCIMNRFESDSVRSSSRARLRVVQQPATAGERSTRSGDPESVLAVPRCPDDPAG